MEQLKISCKSKCTLKYIIANARQGLVERTLISHYQLEIKKSLIFPSEYFTHFECFCAISTQQITTNQ